MHDEANELGAEVFEGCNFALGRHSRHESEGAEAFAGFLDVVDGDGVRGGGGGVGSAEVASRPAEAGDGRGEGLAPVLPFAVGLAPIGADGAGRVAGVARADGFGVGVCDVAGGLVAAAGGEYRGRNALGVGLRGFSAAEPEASGGETEGGHKAPAEMHAGLHTLTVEGGLVAGGNACLQTQHVIRHFVPPGATAAEPARGCADRVLLSSARWRGVRGLGE